MPKTHRPLLVLLSVAITVLMATPVGAESLSTTRARRDAARARRAQIAAQINTLKSTDTQIETAVHLLDAQVGAQQATVEAARQAADAARVAQDAADSKLAATEVRIAHLRSAVVARAVDAYIRPRQTPLSSMFTSKSIGDASRKSQLLTEVASTDTDIIDSLRSAIEDLSLEQGAVRKARALADTRRKAADGRLAELKASQLQQLRLAAALHDRIASFAAESGQLASIESSLSALIQSKEAASQGSFDGTVSAAGIIWPLRGPVTSEFGPRWGGFHPGIDIAAPSGTPIHAAKAGTVIFAGYNGGYGNFVCIDHGGGFTTCYAHQSRIAVSDGQQVSQGQVIGYEGSTGYSTGPHLHFETRINGNPQNPRRYLP
jgi:murein DD-endopeptidase MepM/ murein hydrolase activator NlpD